MGDKFQVGGEAAAAAGAVGRHAEAGTDWKVESQILTYSRAKGLFAGIDLGGSWVERDKDSTVAFYGKHDSAVKTLLHASATAETTILAIGLGFLSY